MHTCVIPFNVISHLLLKEGGWSLCQYGKNLMLSAFLMEKDGAQESNQV